MKAVANRRNSIAGHLCTYIFALAMPVLGFADSVEDDITAYLKDKNPQSISDYAGAFGDIYGKHAPVIKESTLFTVQYYFSEADESGQQDINTLAYQAVTAAIESAKSDGNEDDLAAFITDAVCGAFQGGIHAAYKQVTSAGNAVEGGLQAALDAGIEPGYAGTAVTRGVDTCLQERLENAVALVIAQAMGDSYSYVAPVQAYLPPTQGSGGIELFDDPPAYRPPNRTSLCVSNCI
jgi:hypothetical protein